MRFTDLDNTSYVCDSKQIRLICGNPSNHAWKHYRSLVEGVKPRSRYMTLRQAYFVWTCKGMHDAGRRKIKKNDVIRTADAVLQVDPRSFNIIAALSGSRPMSGHDLLVSIEQCTGKRIPKRTAYHKCNSKTEGNTPRFSTVETYTPEQVRRIMRAIA